LGLRPLTASNFVSGLILNRNWFAKNNKLYLSHLDIYIQLSKPEGKKSEASDLTPTLSGRNPKRRIFRHSPWEEIRSVGFNATACGKKSEASDFSPQPVGRNPKRRI
jgi:hypothetical protein